MQNKIETSLRDFQMRILSLEMEEEGATQGMEVRILKDKVVLMPIDLEVLMILIKRTVFLQELTKR